MAIRESNNQGMMDNQDDDAKLKLQSIKSSDDGDKDDEGTRRNLFLGKIDLLKNSALDLSNSRNDVIPMRT